MNGQLLSISIAASVLLLGCSTEPAGAGAAGCLLDQHDDRIDGSWAARSSPPST
jgi:hypothetical protein